MRNIIEREVLSNKEPTFLNNVGFDYTKMKELVNEYGSSFYILDVNKLRENYKKINTAFNNRYKNFIIGYSYKTNYIPYLCKELSELGAHAEVVSRLEYDLAIKIGVDPKKIIFNGPIKSQEDISLALDNGSKINIDSIYEIDFIKDYCQKNKEKQVKVGLRVNFDLSTDGISPISDGYEVSRFGICLENGDLKSAISKLRAINNVEIVGLHGHFSTSMRSTESYAKITQGLCNIAKKFELNNLEYIDIGGGISGEVPKSLRKYAPTFDEYAETVCSILNNNFGHFEHEPTLILEPGISMVANVFLFVAKVIESKVIRNHHFVVVDGSVHNIKPTLHNSNLPMTVLRKRENSSNREKVFNIVGYTCMEKDYLAHKIHAELPQRGDYVIFENVGAYTIVFTPPFIKERPAIIAVEQERSFVIRKKETIKQFFNEEIYIF